MLSFQSLTTKDLAPPGRRKKELVPGSRAEKAIIVGGFSAVIAAFLVSFAYTDRLLHSIDEPSLSIIVDTAPSIRALSALREEVRRLGMSFADPRMSRRIHQILKSIDQLSADYEALPTYSGEQSLWLQAKKRIDDSKSAATKALSPESSVADGSRIKLFDAIEDSLLATNRLLEANAVNASQLARQIRNSRQNSIELYLLFSISGIVVTFVAAMLSIRAMRSRARIAEMNWRLIEQRSQELEHFSDRVAHDILSPLGLVSLGIDTALKQDLSNDAARTLLAKAQKGLQRVKQMVSDLLEFARSGAKPAPNAYAPVRQAINDAHETFQPIASQDSILLLVESTIRPEAKVFCAPGLLMSLLTNLIDNAIKYMGESKHRRVIIRAIEENRAVRFEVEDTGRGIPTGMETTIFQPYVRGPGKGQGGLGLGLATVRRLVDAHAGNLGVETKEGNGSRFWFTLPKPPQSPMARDRRNAQRTDAAFVAQYTSDFANFDCHTENISRTGVRLLAPHPLPVGSQGRVTLTLKDGRCIQSYVRVKHSNHQTTGLEFLNPDLQKAELSEILGQSPVSTSELKTTP